MEAVSLVILHFSDQKLTKQCLISAEKLKSKGFQLKTIVVDNNPKENLTALAKQFKKATFLKTKTNLGFAGGNNVGIKKAIEGGAEGIFLINNDTLLDKNLVVQLVKVMKADKKIGVLGPKIYFAPGYEYHQSRYKPAEQGKVFWYAGGEIDWRNILASHRGVDEVDRGQYDKKASTDFVSGCAMFIRREVVEKIGLLDERYFLYLEDADFCQRAKKAGFKVVYSPRGKLWHFNAGSSEVGGSLHDYFLTRNRLLFGFRHATLKAKLALAKESVKLLLKGRPWQRVAIRDFYARRFGQGSWRFKPKN